MRVKLPENIRSFRKQRSLTQEQLAEVLGVSAGAVYKWEAGLSTPELGLILEMADFFSTSVDVLLGYEMKDNHLEATVARLWKLNSEKDRRGLAEAEKALKRFPHDLRVVSAGAFMYQLFGEEEHDRKLLHRSLELLERSLLLFDQNTDPMGDKLLIYQNMASIYSTLGETQKAIDLLRNHNPGGLLSDRLGLILAADSRDYKAALPCLSHSLLLLIDTLVRTSLGFACSFLLKGDDRSAEDVLSWGKTCLSGLRSRNGASYIDRLLSLFHVCLACCALRAGRREDAEGSAGTALELAHRFDADPNYHIDSYRFVTDTEWTFTAGDNLGKTALESLDKVVSIIADDAFSAFWEEAKRGAGSPPLS